MKPTIKQYTPKNVKENFETNFIKYLMQKYPTKPDTIAPTVSNIKSELTISSIV